MKKTNDKTDNRLKQTNKAKAHQFFELMEYQLESEDYKLVETKTAIELIHLESNTQISKELKNQVVRGELEVTEESAKEQLDLLMRELESIVNTSKILSGSDSDVDDKFRKWFKFVSHEAFEQGQLYSLIDDSYINEGIQRYKEYHRIASDDFIETLKACDDSEVITIFNEAENNLNSPHYWEFAKREVKNIIVKFKRDHYISNSYDMTQDLTEKFVEYLKGVLDKHNIDIDLAVYITIKTEDHEQMHIQIKVVDVTTEYPEGQEYKKTLINNGDWYSYFDYTSEKAYDMLYQISNQLDKNIESGLELSDLTGKSLN